MFDCSTTLIPGETDIHRFDIPYDSSIVQKAIISYVQCEEVVFEVTASSIESGGTDLTYIYVELSQENSLRLRDNIRLVVQLNVLFTSGARLTSKEICLPVGKQYHREVMT